MEIYVWRWGRHGQIVRDKTDRPTPRGEGVPTMGTGCPYTGCPYDGDGYHGNGSTHLVHLPRVSPWVGCHDVQRCGAMLAQCDLTVAVYVQNHRTAKLPRIHKATSMEGEEKKKQKK